MTIAYIGIAIVGVVNIAEGDYYGVALVACAVTGAWLFNRRWFHAAFWTWQILVGLGAVLQLDFSGLLTSAVGAFMVVVGLLPPARAAVVGPAIAPPVRVSTDLASHAAIATAPSFVGAVAEPGVEPPSYAAATAPADLRILTIGRLKVLAKGEDITADLVGKPLLALVLLEIIVRAIRSRESTVSRTTLAEVLSPRLDASQQRRRFRNTLHDLQRKLPDALGSRIRVEGESVRFDLTDVELDVDWLRWYDRAVRDKSLLDPGLETSLSAQLESIGSGEFLPDWEDASQKVPDASGSDHLVISIRAEVDGLRVNLAAALARSYLAAGQPAKAARPLELVLPVAQDREDVQRLLVTVYQQTGQHVKAAEIAAEINAAEGA